jgi:hypothetical protein
LTNQQLSSATIEVSDLQINLTAPTSIRRPTGTVLIVSAMKTGKEKEQITYNNNNKSFI